MAATDTASRICGNSAILFVRTALVAICGGVGAARIKFPGVDVHGGGCGDEWTRFDVSCAACPVYPAQKQLSKTHAKFAKCANFRSSYDKTQDRGGFGAIL